MCHRVLDQLQKRLDNGIGLLGLGIQNKATEKNRRFEWPEHNAPRVRFQRGQRIDDAYA